MRWVITRVLPEPGPASTSSGPSVVITASRWRGFSPRSRAGSEEDEESADVLGMAGASLWQSVTRRKPERRRGAHRGGVAAGVLRGNPVIVHHREHASGRRRLFVPKPRTSA